MTPVIEVSNVSKRFRVPHTQHGTLRGRALHPFQRTTYEEFVALDDVSFTVADGEFFGIIGHNGSGKSTLLKMLAGIYKPDRGTVTIRGSVAPFIELGVGFNPELSGRDNVFVNGALLGLTPARLRERYNAIVEFAELDRFMDMKLRNFSSGMQVRLAFSIALEAGADILLTDEVLAVGDARFQQKCFEVFRQRKAEGKTVVFVSHDLGAMADFCDRVLLLERGIPLAIDEPRVVIHRYQMSEVANLVSTVIDDGTDARSNSPARIADVRVVAEDDAIPNGDTIVVEIDIEYREYLNDAVIEMMIKDRLGKIMLMGNTYWHDMPTGPRQAGELVTARFEVPNLLAAGHYSVTAALSDAVVNGSMRAERMDLREEAATFDVTASRITQAAVNVPIDIELRSESRVPQP